MLKERYIEFIEITFALLLFVIFLICIPIFFYKVAFGCFAVIMLTLVVFQVLDIIKLHKALHNTDCVVKDKMISKEKDAIIAYVTEDIFVCIFRAMEHILFSIKVIRGLRYFQCCIKLFMKVLIMEMSFI